MIYKVVRYFTFGIAIAGTVQVFPGELIAYIGPMETRTYLYYANGQFVHTTGSLEHLVGKGFMQLVHDSPRRRVV